MFHNKRGIPLNPLEFCLKIAYTYYFYFFFSKLMFISFYMLITGLSGKVNNPAFDRECTW